MFLLIIGFAFPALSQNHPNSFRSFSPVPSAAAREFALNNLTFAIYHEAGHLLISEFSLPVLGKEEDAADNIATMLLLAKQAQEANNALLDSATGWQISAKNGWATKSDPVAQNLAIAALNGDHSSDQLRAGQIGCLMVGSRREVFAHVALDLGMQGLETDACASKLTQIVQSWLRLREKFIPTGRPLGTIQIEYDNDARFAEEAQLLATSGLFEGLVQTVLEKYALPRDIRLRAASCNVANAYYDPAAGELLICYELVGFYLNMGTKQG